MYEENLDLELKKLKTSRNPRRLGAMFESSTGNGQPGATATGIVSGIITVIIGIFGSKLASMGITSGELETLVNSLFTLATQTGAVVTSAVTIFGMARKLVNKIIKNF